MYRFALFLLFCVYISNQRWCSIFVLQFIFSACVYDNTHRFICVLYNFATIPLLARDCLTLLCLFMIQSVVVLSFVHHLQAGAAAASGAAAAPPAAASSEAEFSDYMTLVEFVSFVFFCTLCISFTFKTYLHSVVLPRSFH